MEIHALRLTLTEDDLNAMMNKELAKHPMMKNVRLRVLPEGIHVTGTLQALLNFHFESNWSLNARDGKFAAQLTHFKALGMSAGLLKVALMRFIAEASRKTDGIHIDADTVLVDVERVISREGVAARINLSSIVTIEGAVLVEAGA